MTPANDLDRIGPQKLSRVLRHGQDSTVTGQDADYSPLNAVAHRHSPTTITGDTFQLNPLEQKQQSYFQLPHRGPTRGSGSVITPNSLMDATTAESPQLRSARNGELDLTHSQGDTVLLVEDNAINMRVSLQMLSIAGIWFHVTRIYTLINPGQNHAIGQENFEDIHREQ